MDLLALLKVPVDSASEEAEEADVERRAWKPELDPITSSSMSLNCSISFVDKAIEV